MSLLTPVGAIRVFVDYHPVACELCRIKTGDEKADCRYRLIIRFKPDDDGQHLIMCCLRANQEISVSTDIQKDYSSTTYSSLTGGLKLSIAFKADRLFDHEDIKAFEERESAFDYDLFIPVNNGENDFYNNVFLTYPETRTDVFTFGIAWSCDMNAADDTAMIREAESALTDEAEDMATMFDADDDHTENYGISREDFYKYSAEGGNAYSMAMLGYMYQEGIFASQDPVKAEEYFQMALDSGDAKAKGAVRTIRHMYHMTRFNFQMFMDYTDGKIARLETTGDDEIPVNIVIDNYEDVKYFNPQLCMIDVCGIGSDVDVFKNEEEFAKSDVIMAPISMIPAGTFSIDPDNMDFQQSPYIVFCGIVEEVEYNAEAKDEEANYCLLIKTLEMEISLYIRYDGVIEKGNIVYAVAWLFGNMYRNF